MRLISDVIDIGEAAEFHIAGVSGVYRISQNIVLVELYALKIIEGKLRRVVVLRNTWDRSNWLAAQREMAKAFGHIAELPDESEAREIGEAVH